MSCTARPRRSAKSNIRYDMLRASHADKALERVKAVSHVVRRERSGLRRGSNGGLQSIVHAHAADKHLQSPKMPEMGGREAEIGSHRVPLARRRRGRRRRARARESAWLKVLFWTLAQPSQEGALQQRAQGHTPRPGAQVTRPVSVRWYSAAARAAQGASRAHACDRSSPRGASPHRRTHAHGYALQRPYRACGVRRGVRVAVGAQTAQLERQTRAVGSSRKHTTSHAHRNTQGLS